MIKFKLVKSLEAWRAFIEEVYHEGQSGQAWYERNGGAGRRWLVLPLLVLGYCHLVTEQWLLTLLSQCLPGKESLWCLMGAENPVRRGSAPCEERAPLPTLCASWRLEGEGQCSLQGEGSASRSSSQNTRGSRMSHEVGWYFPLALLIGRFSLEGA